MMPSASIVIVTRNRKAVAEQAVRSALAQRGDVEVVVVDDGSTDGTCEYLRERFPDPRLKIHRFDRQEGYIVQRNRGARLATAPILFSIDDDAVINDPGVLPDVLRLFAHPRVGAVMVPFHNCGPDDKDPGRLMTAMAPDDGRVYVTNTFVGTAYAVRRDVFLQLGGFREILYHWAEETEFCQRLLGAGWVVRVGTRPSIRHYPGAVAGKYSRRVNRFIARNRLLTVWLNAPTAYLPPLWFAQHLMAVRDVVRRPSEAAATVEGVAMAYGSAARTWSLRRPLPTRAFRLWLQLRKRQSVNLAEIERDLPPLLSQAVPPAQPVPAPEQASAPAPRPPTI
jgi:glycosyltransferase involved in cell wall biosynthesis